MSAERTPTPWKMSGKSELRSEGGGLVFRLTLRVVGDVHWRNRDANAEFIVRAANSHDALVAALKHAEPWVESGPAGSWRDGVMAEIAAALTKAEGRS